MGTSIRTGPPLPLSSAWRETKCAPQKSKAELLGLVQGILADGVVVEEEAQFLKNWIYQHEEMRTQWPCDVLFDRLENMLEDRVLDPEEQRELLARLCDYLELRKKAENVDLARVVTSDKKVTVNSPFDDPVPAIDHMGRVFVVTGEFASLSRKKVVSEIELRGGSVNSSVSRKVNFLLIGSLGSELWANETYGTKIDSAISLRKSGVPICIVPEKSWFDSIGSDVS